MSLHDDDLAPFRCPYTGQRLRRAADGSLESEDGTRCYPVLPMGIPLFATDGLTRDAAEQQRHYDRIAAVYCANLGYPHTEEYSAYLDRALMEIVVGEHLGTVAELCCGRCEACRLFASRSGSMVGIDISSRMLEEAERDLGDRCTFAQGDATRLPLAPAAFDTVFMLGGIHHVRDRSALFAEVRRVLKPGGYFYWREPVSDFFLWRWIRAVVYRVSPLLEAETERPLLWEETVPPLERAGLAVEAWRTVGFLGFCLFMNSDVLVFNRAFRFVPGIRRLTRFFCGLDEMTRRIPGFGRSGLIVVGRARKSAP
jgi:ubiquinone/menaquinone biosynthesis C-methylase UbiE